MVKKHIQRKGACDMYMQDKIYDHPTLKMLYKLLNGHDENVDTHKPNKMYAHHKAHVNIFGNSSL